MPERVPRRSVLQGIALGAGAVALAPRVRTWSHVRNAVVGFRPARIRDLPPGPPSPDTPLYRGNVVSVAGSFMNITAPDGTATVFTLSPSTSVWKGGDGAGVASITPGDWVYVDPQESSRGMLVAARIWDNIAWRDGPVVGVSGTSVVVDDPVRGPSRVQLTSGTVVNPGGPNSGMSASQALGSGTLGVGAVVSALGMVVPSGPGPVSPRTGSLVCTRLWV